VIILNLTQHVGTPDQGVVEPSQDVKGAIVALLTFDTLPSGANIKDRAAALAAIAAEFGADAAMIGGAPYLMAPLEEALKAAGIRPLYAFSLRESVEVTQPDGSVRKVATFRHQGFVG
jgi:hypothetical protein